MIAKQRAPRAMILAAGLSTRLELLSALRPKPLLPVCGVSLLRFLVSWLVRQGVREIVVNYHHLGEQIREELGDGRAFGANITFSDESVQILGTGGALRRARELLDDGTDAPIVVVNGKLILDLDLAEVLAFHRERESEATMVLVPNQNAEQFSVLAVDERAKVVTLRGRTLSGTQPLAPMMFSGVHVLQPRFLDRIKEPDPCCVIDAAYNSLFDERGAYFGVVTDRYVWEHSTPARYLQGVENVLAGKVQWPQELGTAAFVHETAEIAKSAVLRQPVWIGERAVVGEGAIVGPYVQLGAGAEVCAGTRVEHGIVWDGVRVETDLCHAIATAAGVVPARL